MRRLILFLLRLLLSRLTGVGRRWRCGFCKRGGLPSVRMIRILFSSFVFPFLFFFSFLRSLYSCLTFAICILVRFLVCSFLFVLSLIAYFILHFQLAKIPLSLWSVFALTHR